MADSDLETRVTNLEKKYEKINDELTYVREKLASIETKIDTLQKQNEKLYNLLKWIVGILLAIIGAVIGVRLPIP